jgi:hypothetical protein
MTGKRRCPLKQKPDEAYDYDFDDMPFASADLHGRDQRATPMLPERRKKVRRTSVPPSPVPVIEEPPRPRIIESRFDKLWRHIEEVSVAWLDLDVKYILFFFSLSAPFSIRPRNVVRMCMKEPFALSVVGESEIAMITHPSFMFAEKETFHVRADFNAEAVKWLGRVRKAPEVVLKRSTMPQGPGKKLGKRRAFIPIRAGHLPSF